MSGASNLINAIYEMDVEEITCQLLGERLITHFDSQKYVDWAVTLLENGLESESLIILAGLDFYGTDERERYFWKSVEELGLNIEKNEPKQLKSYAIFIVKQVIEGKIDPMTGLSKMYAIWLASDYSQGYIQFYEISENLDYMFYSAGQPIFDTGLTLDNQEEYIKEEFRLFLQMEELNIDELERKKSFCLRCNNLTEPILKTRIQFKKPFKHQVWVCRNCNSEKLEHSGYQSTKRRIIENVMNSRSV